MLILGIDPASVRCGYGVIRADGELLAYLDAGVLSAPESWDKYRRLAEIGRCLDQVFEKHNIDAVAIEAGFVKGQMGALTSGAARGVCGYLAARRGIAVFEYQPTTVKKAATANGAAAKEIVANCVRLRLRLNRTPEADAADALATAICHAMAVVTQRRRTALGA
jgi:crossover junction endodeoxyribonuclease RuvC